MEKQKEIDYSKLGGPDFWNKDYIEINYGNIWAYIKALAKQYPNDQELGKEVRKSLNQEENGE